MPTELRIESEEWWPTKGSVDRKLYVGSVVCARCHAQQAASQMRTSMAQAAVPASDSELKSYPELHFQLGPYRYEVETKDGRSVLSVTNGTDKATEHLEWALGKGNFGQSYVYEDGGKYYESQLSFYTTVKSLDITTGHSREVPPDLGMAAGGYTPLEDIRQCFGCHFTASSANDRFDPALATPGVTCEACHGPGASHVALMSSGMRDAKGIMDPESLNAVDSVDFCGACHRTYADVVFKGLSKAGIINVRLQPYRLEKSKCWRNGDARLTCVACHDPHVEVVRDAAFYDSKCLRCHRASRKVSATEGHPGAACKVGSEGCVRCHMPKVEVPGTHSIFTDHWIRVARAGEPYPS